MNFLDEYIKLTLCAQEITRQSLVFVMITIQVFNFLIQYIKSWHIDLYYIGYILK